MTELELKFAVPDAVLPSLRQDLLARGAKAVRLRAHYFDTCDLALARHRAALRLRLEGRHWVQTLKAPGAGAVHRLEHELRVAGHPRTRPALDLARHEGSAAAQGLAAALRTAADPALQELHATDVLRLQLRLQSADGTEIEAALDTGAALAAGRRDALQELELEHKGGPLPGLFAVAIACVRHGGLWQSTLTKAERGLRLRFGPAGPRRTPFAPVEPVQAEAGAMGAGLAQAFMLRACLQAAMTPLLAHASELATATQADAAFDDVATAFGDDLERLQAVLQAAGAAATAAAPGWRARLHGARRQWLRARHDPVALGALVRGVPLQVLWLQCQQLAHAQELPVPRQHTRRAQQSAALVAAGVLRA